MRVHWFFGDVCHRSAVCFRYNEEALVMRAILFLFDRRDLSANFTGLTEHRDRPGESGRGGTGEEMHLFQEAYLFNGGQRRKLLELPLLER